MATNVLEQAASGPEIGNKCCNCRPEMAVILRAQSLPGEREGLTRISSGDEVKFMPELTAIVRCNSCPGLTLLWPG